MSTTTLSTNLLIGAAAIAGLSAYWIITTYRKPSKDVDFLRANLEALQLRLNDLEKREQEKKTSKLRRQDSPPKWKSKSFSQRQQQQQQKHVRQSDESIKDDDSNANVLPTSCEEEDSVFTPPQTIITMPKEDKAMQFLRGKDSVSHQIDSVSHHSINAQASETSLSIDRAPVPIVLISDPGQDLDDEMMLIMARHLVDLKLMSLEGVIANLSPSFARARLTRGTLDLLGLPSVPVGIGSDGGDVLGTHKSDQFENTASSYIINENGEAARSLESGFRLLQRLYDAAPDVEYVDVDCLVDRDKISGVQEDSTLNNEDRDNDRGNTIQRKSNTNSKKVVSGGITIVITSSMKDIAIFVRDNPTLFASKTREVVVMGGCKPVPIPDPGKKLTTNDTSGSQSSSQNSSLNVWETLSTIECEPDAANNNSFDPAASAYFYSQCQKMNITLTVVSRFAAYSAKMPRSVYDDLALTGSSIGWRLRNSQRCSIDQLWRRACSLDPEIRQGLPLRCDRNWFINTFCGGVDDHSRCSADTAWDLVTGFMQYDTIALFAAVPAIRERFFDPFVMPPLQRAKVKMGRRRSTYSGPPAIARAIARAREDSELTETPFQSSVSSVPKAFDRGTRNLIGISDELHNIHDPNLLVDLLETGYRQGILCDHHTQPHIILHLHLRWDNLADTLLTCLMLRSLWDTRLASVLGVIVSINPSDSAVSEKLPDGMNVSGVDNDEQGKSAGDKILDDVSTGDAQSSPTLCDLAETIRDTLTSIGLAHVKFIVVSGKDMTEHKMQSSQAFCELYQAAPPIGVTLVLTATFSSVWPFTESHPDLFRNKTVRVVHTGGALIWPAEWGWASIPFAQSNGDHDDSNDDLINRHVTDEKILVPDPAAQNHRLDMSSAQLFYKRSQALSVPMVILSRHVAKECCISRNFFDILGSHGGEVGRKIFDSERNSLLHLWRCSCAPSGSTARGNLPERCDATWFAENFCAGTKVHREDEVWKNVDAVNLYSPIALLAALPGETLKAYFHTIPFTVRSATHHVIGLTEEVPPQNVVNPCELRRLVVQSLLSAALVNDSTFRQDPPPRVPIRMNHEPRRLSNSSSHGPFASSIISTLTLSGGRAANEDDMWSFTEADRKDLFGRTLAQTSKNAIMPKEKKRKFVMDMERRIAATIGCIPLQALEKVEN